MMKSTTLIAVALVLAGAPAEAQSLTAIKVNPATLKLKGPPTTGPVSAFKGRFDPNFAVLTDQPMADVTITINGSGRIKGPGFNCIAAAGKSGTVCNRKMPENSPVLLEAFGKDGNVLTNWVGACSGNAVKCGFTPKGKVQLAATFGPPPVQQMASIKVMIPEGAGSVKAGSFTPNGLDCTKAAAGGATGTCTVKVPLGQQVSLVAAPAAGSAFNGWESEQPGCAGFECAFTAQDPVTLTARFGSKTTTAKLTIFYQRGWLSNLAIGTDPKQSFACTPTNPPVGPDGWLATCTANIPTGTTVQVSGTWMVAPGYMSAVPNSGWTGDCVAKTGGVCTVSMTSDRTILVSWN